ncbi:MAG: hypothetical protein OER86_03045, partial [Phycisphaerae bacterium]|nr:hypothetical protein [Phycisphaerae bacterium]
PGTQARLVSAAIENDLLDLEQGRQLLTWPGLETPVKLIVAAQLAAAGKLKDQAALDAGVKSDNLALRGLAATIQLQLGESAGATHLQSILESKDTGRDNACLFILQTAVRHEFAVIGPWALKLASGGSENRTLDLLSLQAALRFGATGAVDQWQQQFAATSSTADRIRLSLTALSVAEHVAPAAFAAMAKDEAELIQRIGAAGYAVAGKQPAAEPILKLLEMNHTLANRWALQHARRIPIEQATPLLAGLVLNAEGKPNPTRFRAERLENAVRAVRDLAERSPRPGALFANLFAQVPELSQEAMLMGLITSRAESPRTLLEGVRIESPTGQALATLLKARHGPAPAAGELSQLGLIARGGAGLQEPLRVQAAWLYLKWARQEKFALASVLDK